MRTFPPELLLHLIPFLPLTSLVAARSVDTRWRSLAQVAHLHPSRKALLDLYLAAIAHPKFPGIVAALCQHLRAFDREAYVADLVARGCVLPDLFELWVLEWPSKAVYFWAWPGLAKEVRVGHAYYTDGDNLLGDNAPILGADLPTQTSVGVETCQGLALWQTQPSWSEMGVVQSWLVVSVDEKIHDGRMGCVIWTYSLYLREQDGTRYLGPKMVMHKVPLLADNLIQFLDVRLSDQPSTLLQSYFERILQPQQERRITRYL